jgi:hypothetical protein
MFEATPEDERGTKQVTDPGTQVHSCSNGVCSIVLVYGAGEFGSDFTNFRYSLKCATDEATADEATAEVTVNVAQDTSSAPAELIRCPSDRCPHASPNRKTKIELPTGGSVLYILTPEFGASNKLFQAVEENGQAIEGPEITEYPFPVSPINGKRIIYAFATQALEYKFRYRIDTDHHRLIENDDVVKWLNKKEKYTTGVSTQSEFGSENQVIITPQNANQKPTAWPSIVTIVPGGEITVSLDGSDADATGGVGTVDESLVAVLGTLPGAGVQLYDQADPSKVLETENTVINDVQRRVIVKLPATATACTHNYAQFSFRVRDSAGLESDPVVVRIDVGTGAAEGCGPSPSPSPSPSPADGTLIIALNAGWTWVSFNRESSSPLTIAAVMSGMSFSANDVIKSQTSYTQYYDGFGWFGQMTAFDMNQMYAVKMSAAKTLLIPGTPVSLPSTLTVQAGWNWIPMHQTTDQTDLTSFVLANATGGEMLKSQTTFTQYYDGFGWFGGLTKLEPGRGYKLKLSGASEITFS